MTFRCDISAVDPLRTEAVIEGRKGQWRSCSPDQRLSPQLSCSRSSSGQVAERGQDVEWVGNHDSPESPLSSGLRQARSLWEDRVDERPTGWGKRPVEALVRHGLVQIGRRRGRMEALEAG